MTKRIVFGIVGLLAISPPILLVVTAIIATWERMVGLYTFAAILSSMIALYLGGMYCLAKATQKQDKEQRGE